MPGLPLPPKIGDLHPADRLHGPGHLCLGLCQGLGLPRQGLPALEQVAPLQGVGRQVEPA